MTYRDDVAALASRHADLQREVATKSRELAATSKLLAETRARARLPVLDNIRVASPCTVSWAAMVGDDRVRHCGHCDKDVYNLSGMTRDEAEALVVGRAGALCVRYFQRFDGTVLTADCPVGAKKQRKQRRLIVAGAAAGAVAAGLTGAGIAAHERSGDVPAETMGLLANPREVLGGIGRIDRRDPAIELDHMTIEEGIRHVQDRVMACRDVTPARGTVEVSVRVKPDGSVAGIEVRQTPDAKLGECVAEVLRDLWFAPTKTGGRFVYPFVF
jgi:hypothetical protein